MSIKESSLKWTPRKLWTPTMTLLIALMISKLLLFDIVWCAETTWSGLNDVRLYVHTILLSFLLSIPIGMFRRKWLQIGFMVAMDIVLPMLLYHEGLDMIQCPVIRWLLIDVLPDMKTEITYSPVWIGLLMFLTTLTSFFVCLKNPGRNPIPLQGKIQYCGYLSAWSFIAWLLS